ncbi:MAG: Rieske 2Fe-2S domain-containing protein [Chloroflexota bacterium]
MSATPHPTSLIEKPNRREFFYYLGGASLMLLGAGSIGVLARFLNPPQTNTSQHKIFEVDLTKIPEVGKWPVAFPAGRYWLVHVDEGLIALYGACSFMRGLMREGCLPKWVPTNNRFECPCCGSKYQLDGTWIEGPAQRGLDRYFIEVTTPNGVITTPPDGAPVNIEGATKIVVDTNRLIYGQPRPS